MKRYAWIAVLTYICPAHAGPLEKTNEALQIYNRCYLEQLRLFERLCEPADQLAVAIVRGCPAELENYQNTAIGSFGFDDGSKIVNGMISIRKDQAIAAIMRKRLESPCN